MIDISDSVARQTVHFDQLISGQALIDAVKAACGSSYREELRYDDGEQYLVGQSSMVEPYKNLLVTPTKTEAYIKLDHFYNSAVVLRHDALGSDPRSDMGMTRGFSRHDEIQAVLELAENLPNFLPGGQQQAGPGLSRDPYAPAAAATRRPDDVGQTRPRSGSPAAGDNRSRDARSPAGDSWHR